jgi:hypothetical protein
MTFLLEKIVVGMWRLARRLIKAPDRPKVTVLDRIGEGRGCVSRLCCGGAAQRWRTSRSGILLACCTARSPKERRTLIVDHRFLRRPQGTFRGWSTGVAPLRVGLAEEALVVAKDPTVRACFPLAEKEPHQICSILSCRPLAPTSSIS